MKTTVVIDSAKLKRVMKLTGIKTCRKAIDFALDQAERAAQIEKVFAGAFFINDEDEVVDPRYDVLRERALERKKSNKHRTRGRIN